MRLIKFKELKTGMKVYDSEQAEWIVDEIDDIHNIHIFNKEAFGIACLIDGCKDYEPLYIKE
tara:strand:+ start:238 stop:423 length:186 start_codon:yes stop_codon:yes gene_type:complete